MFRADVRFDRRDFDAYRKHVLGAYERAALRTSSVIVRRGKAAIRDRMAGAGLGRLGNAIDANADENVARLPGGGFSASARFFIRSQSERTLGAIEAYTEGADILPVRSRWLWVPTDNARRLAGSNFKGGKGQRMTPALWRERGYDKKVGPLIQIKSVNGYPLLAVQNVGVDLSGRKPSARPLTKKGMPRKGQIARELVVMFVGIPRTARAARVNITEILISIQSELMGIFESELAKEWR